MLYFINYDNFLIQKWMTYYTNVNYLSSEKSLFLISVVFSFNKFIFFFLILKNKKFMELLFC